MKVIHKTEDPSSPVGGSLAQTSPDSGTFAAAGRVAGNAGVGELTLLVGKPPGFEGAVGEYESGEDGDCNRECALDYK